MRPGEAAKPGHDLNDIMMKTKKVIEYIPGYEKHEEVVRQRDEARANGMKYTGRDFAVNRNVYREYWTREPEPGTLGKTY